MSSTQCRKRALADTTREKEKRNSASAERT
jgi:hypothetical protein